VRGRWAPHRLPMGGSSKKTDLFDLACGMRKGPREQKERNSAIVFLRKNGMSATDIAARFDISPGRVSAIVDKLAPVERRRSKLRKNYGARPNGHMHTRPAHLRHPRFPPQPTCNCALPYRFSRRCKNATGQHHCRA
jgi:hypothetical protein